jgi:hypothetical protein
MHAAVWGLTGLVIPAWWTMRRTISSSAMPVEPAAVGGQEGRPLAPFANSQVDHPGGARRQRDGDDLAALAGDHQGAVAALDAQGLDVATGRPRDA